MIHEDDDDNIIQSVATRVQDVLDGVQVVVMWICLAGATWQILKTP